MFLRTLTIVCTFGRKVSVHTVLTIPNRNRIVVSSSDVQRAAAVSLECGSQDTAFVRSKCGDAFVLPVEFLSIVNKVNVASAQSKSHLDIACQPGTKQIAAAHGNCQNIVCMCLQAAH